MSANMDQFVNWDHAAVSQAEEPAPESTLAPQPTNDSNLNAPSQDIDPSLLGMMPAMNPSLDNIGLTFENIDEDDFSFFALQHFASGNPDVMTASQPDATAAAAAPLATAVNYNNDNTQNNNLNDGNAWPQFAGTTTTSAASSAPSSNPMLSMAGELLPTGHSDGSNRSSLVDLNNLGLSSSRSMTPAGAGTGSTAATDAHPGVLPPKVGARFSRESVRILKDWLTTHNRHPYPSDEEKELLQRKTGLNKTQITNWLANARRRGKVHPPPRSTSPHPGIWAPGSIDIPQRRGTPAMESMNPLQRWEHSPPENEPASVSAIARAVTASSSAGSSAGLHSSVHSNWLADDGSGRSLCNQSSASSLGTSHSNSESSAYSYNSHNSLGSFGSGPFSNSRSRRRRRRKTSHSIGNKRSGSGDGAARRTELRPPAKTFQCTFCTETFRTKHDWQRHEKSLHLSLERWVCAPHGSKAVNPETGQLSCVYCGLANPDTAHIESHNHSTCQDRHPGERTFYRKDHLNQHLRLVHNVKFMDWSMKSWKVATPEICARCGFCGIRTDSWAMRVDHLAEHFKAGSSMADWRGDWGFDTPVLEMVENSIPPYLIHHERASPLPYVANGPSHESPRNAYELIKLEMAYFDANKRQHNGRPPTDTEMRIEGCRIIFASETLSLQGIATQASWLRDLIMDTPELQNKARFGPLRGAAENRLASLKINGKDNLFEQCPMEFQLQEFVNAKRLLGLTPMNDELQAEACRIVGRVEEVSTNPSEPVANWLLRLATSSTSWLSAFRRRAQLPRVEDVEDAIVRSTDPTKIDSTVHSYSRLESELAAFLGLQRAMGIEPSNEDLQRQARIIIYEFDDGWNQTAADNISWLEAFKKRHSPADVSPETQGQLHMQPQQQGGIDALFADDQDVSLCQIVPDVTTKNSPFFLNDANCYSRLARELARWASSTMSPNNPNQHVPTDAELKHQARWIVYDEDDPWNQTAADNAEWLLRFKRGLGIIPRDSGPGLTDDKTWSLNQGGTGFAPPYVFPKPGGSINSPEGSGRGSVGNRDLLTPSSTNAASVSARETTYDQSRARHIKAKNSYVESLASHNSRPATVFCSRELENGLVRAVERGVEQTGHVPSAGALRAHARAMLGPGVDSPADDPDLMDRFQRMMLAKMPHARLPLSEEEEARQKERDEERGRGRQRERREESVPAFLLEGQELSDRELEDLAMGMDIDAQMGGRGANLWL